MENQLRLTYSSSVERLREVNSSFDSGVLKVAYAGKNRNGSSISKEAFERSIHTIYNCPIVCNYNREEDMIGSHDMEVVSKNGEMQLVGLVVISPLMMAMFLSITTTRRNLSRTH